MLARDDVGVGARGGLELDVLLEVDNTPVLLEDVDLLDAGNVRDKNYPDLFYHFCKKGCNVEGLHTHFLNHGRQEGRQFGCGATLTAAEKARWAAQAARLKALDSQSHHTHRGAILGIGGGPRNHMLGGPGAGLNNAKDGFFALCQRGRNISYPTLK